MAHVALVIGLGALVAAALPAPGLYLAIGLGIAAAGLGYAAFRRAGDPGFVRLAGAAAVTLGGLGVVLGAVRVVIVLAALRRIAELVAH